MYPALQAFDQVTEEGLFVAMEAADRLGRAT